MKCERVQFIQPHLILRRYINNFREIENSLKTKKLLLKDEEEKHDLHINLDNSHPRVHEADPLDQITLDSIIDKLKAHSGSCENILISCKLCKAYI